MSKVLGAFATTARNSAARFLSMAAPVGFCARGVRITAFASARMAAASESGRIPNSSSATGSAIIPSAAIKIKHAGVARILDRDDIAGRQMGLQNALDAIDGAAYDRDFMRAGT